MAETKEEREQREQRERQHMQTKTTPPQKGGQKEGEEEKVGNPMREDDRQNQFRAPDSKPQGAFYGEDMVQPGPGEGEEEVAELPEGTHPQKPGKQPEQKKEETTAHHR